MNNIFKKIKPKVKKNPDIILNFYGVKKPEYGNGHFLLVANKEDFEIKGMLVNPRKIYTAYPRSIDHNLDKDKQIEIANTPQTIPVKAGFEYIFGTGSLDKNRTVRFLIPKHEDELPEDLKKWSWAVNMVKETRIMRRFIDEMKKGDIETAKLVNETKSAYMDQAMKGVEEFGERLTTLKHQIDKSTKKGDE